MDRAAPMDRTSLMALRTTPTHRIAVETAWVIAEPTSCTTLIALCSASTAAPKRLSADLATTSPVEETEAGNNRGPP